MSNFCFLLIENQTQKGTVFILTHKYINYRRRFQARRGCFREPESHRKIQPIPRQQQQQQQAKSEGQGEGGESTQPPN